MVSDEELKERGFDKVKGGYYIHKEYSDTLFLLAEGKTIPAHVIAPEKHKFYGADRKVFDEFYDRMTKELEQRKTEPTEPPRTVGKGEEIVLDAPPLNEQMMERTIASRMALDLIAEISQDHMGLGIFYDDLGPPIGLEPNANLANLLATQSGLDIQTSILDISLVELKVNDTVRPVWKAHVRATDKYGRSAESVVIEEADQTIAFVKREKYLRKRDSKEVEITRLNEPKSATSKAIRNAQTKLMGYPKEILVPLIQKVMKPHADEAKRKKQEIKENVDRIANKLGPEGVTEVIEGKGK